jgi:hypothetical protein
MKTHSSDMSAHQCLGFPYTVTFARRRRDVKFLTSGLQAVRLVQNLAIMCFHDTNTWDPCLGSGFLGSHCPYFCRGVFVLCILQCAICDGITDWSFNQRSPQ